MSVVHIIPICLMTNRDSIKLKNPINEPLS